MSVDVELGPQSSRVRVSIAADIRLYREGLAIALEAQDGLEVVDRAANAEQAVAAARALGPDVVLVDTAMPEGMTAIRAITARRNAAVIALAVPEREPDVIACVEAGAAGYVTRDGSLGDLVQVIRSVVRGETLCSPRMVALVLRRLASLASEKSPALPVPDLTRREMEIVELIDVGLSNKEIASRLSIGVPTVKNHVHHILEKLRVHRRAEAAARMRALPSWRANLLDRASYSPLVKET